MNDNGRAGHAMPMEYPPPLAQHTAVVAEPALFAETLRQFHSEMGNPLTRMPHMAGKELDLHMLYVQVTVRGGIEKVIKEKKWREVASVFNLPATCTSGSFTLRKIYVKLLHDYEQVYFFNARGKPVPAPVPTVISSRKHEDETKEPHYAKRVPADIKALCGSTVTGTVDSRFEFGYFITVNIDGQQLKGIMYEPTGLMKKGKNTGKVDGVSKRIMKRRRQKLLRQQGVPKQNKTAFNYFSMDARPRAREICGPNVPESDVSKKIGEMWANCSPQERAPYLAQAEQDRQRYNQEMIMYHEKLRERQQAAAAAAVSVQDATLDGFVQDVSGR